jgi:hypothetical protein
VTLTIVLGPTACAVAAALESVCKFNAGYYVSKVLTPLSEWRCELGDGNFGNLRVDADNAHLRKAAVSQQFMAQNGIWLLSTSTYSVVWRDCSGRVIRD